MSIVRGREAMPERSKISRATDAYIIHVMLRPEPTRTQLWMGGKIQDVHTVARGGIMMAHLDAEPSVMLHSDFEFLRLWISTETLDELAREASGLPSAGLRRPEFGAYDPVLLHLASAAAPLLERGFANDQLLIDQLALAIYRRIGQAYGGVPIDDRTLELGGLAPWQIRRAKDIIASHLASPLRVVEIAHECKLSASHFARAFRQSTGRTPHQWQTEQRIEASKSSLLQTDQSIAEVASRNGFLNQSHFSRSFMKFVGESPTAWRRSRNRILSPVR